MVSAADGAKALRLYTSGLIALLTAARKKSVARGVALRARGLPKAFDRTAWVDATAHRRVNA